MRALEVSTHPDLDPDASCALDVAYERRAPAFPQRLTLRGYRLRGEILSLGRFHLTPAGDPAGRVRMHRRLGGGRVLALGPEFAILSLSLPHRSALVGDDPLTLRPEQVLNRCVRGLLAGLRGLGVDAYYPGRDQLTLEGRTLAVVSLAADAFGATTFEAVLAVENGWSALTGRLAAVDPEGVVASELVQVERMTALGETVAHAPSLDELVHVVASAYAAQFGLSPQSADPPAVPADVGARAAAWVGSRRLRPGLASHAAERTQIGVLEAYLRVGQGVIDDALLAGDFIADTPGCERLEQRLRGCDLSAAAIGAVLEEVYADPRSFLLGVGPLQIVADTILRAAGARR